MPEFLSTILEALASPGWRIWVGGLLCLGGGIFTVIAAVGVLRFPDFYTRMHAASVSDTLAAMSLFCGMALMASEFGSPTFFVIFKLFMIGLFMFLTSPVSTHAIGNAAFTAGLHPLTGRYDELHESDEQEGDAS